MSNKKTRGAVVGPTLDALFKERDALRAENAELIEALRELIGAAGALESADSEDGDASRTLTKPLKRARAVLAKAGGK